MEADPIVELAHRVDLSIDKDAGMKEDGFDLRGVMPLGLQLLVAYAEARGWYFDDHSPEGFASSSTMPIITFLMDMNRCFDWGYVKKSARFSVVWTLVMIAIR